MQFDICLWMEIWALKDITERLLNNFLLIENLMH